MQGRGFVPFRAWQRDATGGGAVVAPGAADGAALQTGLNMSAEHGFSHLAGYACARMQN
jgi:hypothetical protein